MGIKYHRIPSPETIIWYHFTKSSEPFVFSDNITSNQWRIRDPSNITFLTFAELYMEASLCLVLLHINQSAFWILSCSLALVLGFIRALIMVMCSLGFNTKPSGRHINSVVDGMERLLVIFLERVLWLIEDRCRTININCLDVSRDDAVWLHIFAELWIFLCS